MWIHLVSFPERPEVPEDKKLQGVNAQMVSSPQSAQKPQMFFWSSDGFVPQGNYSLLSGFYRKRRTWEQEVSMEKDFEHANVHQDWSLKVDKQKYEKEK